MRQVSSVLKTIKKILLYLWQAVGGGIIYYRNTSGFTNTYNNVKCYYLEMAPKELGLYMWARESASAYKNGVYGLKDTIGSGRQNTALIVATTAYPIIYVPAAHACNTYKNNSKEDWFLPSRNELAELSNYYKNVIGNFDNVPAYGYWCSTQFSNSDAYYMDRLGGSIIGMINMVIGISSPFDKTATHAVRPIRAF
ncbi:MAG: DUF1566 domain-containing protein [Treponema sp.]|nr:DUF1566 domain-containing protein [Treponema sp.]